MDQYGIALRDIPITAGCFIRKGQQVRITFEEGRAYAHLNSLNLQGFPVEVGDFKEVKVDGTL